MTSEEGVGGIDLVVEAFHTTMWPNMCMHEPSEADADAGLANQTTRRLNGISNEYTSPSCI